MSNPIQRVDRELLDAFLDISTATLSTMLRSHFQILRHAMVGPVSLTVRLRKRPRSVKLVGERGRFTTRWSKGTLRVKLDSLHVHAIVAIET